MNIKYRLRFLSDWHIGSGTGIPGVVDNGVLKDNRNVPVINGRTIKGITRDALEDILYLTGKSDAAALIDDIFGGEGDKQGNAVFYNPSLCEKESDKTSEQFEDFLDYYHDRHLGEIRYHTAIDKEKGTAREHHLFSEETSERIFEYFGAIDTDETLAKYLIAALRFTTKIGGRRRRGLGQCEFKILEPLDYKTYLERLFT
jgi:CRISPR/Cas system CMR subunit Cmr4 (Cas7 group RAMP superfamily)